MTHLNIQASLTILLLGTLLTSYVNAQSTANQPGAQGDRKQPRSSLRRSLNTLDCGDYWVLSSRALKNNKIKSINATITSEGNVYVRQESIDGNIKSFTRPNDNLVDWANLKGSVYRRQTGDECLMGKAVLGYIEALNSGVLNNMHWTVAANQNFEPASEALKNLNTRELDGTKKKEDKPNNPYYKKSYSEDIDYKQLGAFIGGLLKLNQQIEESKKRQRASKASESNTGYNRCYIEVSNRIASCWVTLDGCDMVGNCNYEKHCDKNTGLFNGDCDSGFMPYEEDYYCDPVTRDHSIYKENLVNDACSE